MNRQQKRKLAARAGKDPAFHALLLSNPRKAAKKLRVALTTKQHDALVRRTRAFRKKLEQLRRHTVNLVLIWSE